MNKTMKEKLSTYSTPAVVLPLELEDILNKGFNVVGDAIFFFSSFELNVLPNEKFIERAYGDLLGYECAINKLNIDDYCNSNCFEIGLLFIEKFREKWIRNFEESAVVILSFDDTTEFGETCAFRFHKKRPENFLFAIDTVEGFVEPILLMEVPQDRL